MKELKLISGNEIIERYSKGKRDFSNSLLNGINLGGANLKGIIFKNCWIKGVSFSRCDLTDASFEGSTIDNFATFINANLTRTNFVKTKIHFIYFENAILKSTDFSNSDLLWCGFPNCNRGGADFTGAKMTHVYWNFDDVDVVKAVEAVLPFIIKSDLPESTKVRLKTRLLVYIDNFKTISKPSYEVKMGFGKILSELYSPKVVETDIQYGTSENLYTDKFEYHPTSEKKFAYQPPSPDKKRGKAYNIKK